MADWAKPNDVIDSWIGEFPPSDDTKLRTWIDKAEREIRYRVPDLADRIAAEEAAVPPRTDLRGLAVDVAVAMVTRVFRNPEGIRQTNTTTGPFTESRTYGGDVPGGLALTDEELTKLQGTRGGAFSIDLIPSTSPFYREP